MTTEDIKNWSTSQVVEWASPIIGAHAEKLKAQEVKGSSLLVYSNQSLKDFREETKSWGIPAGPAGDLYIALSKIKGTTASQDRYRPPNYKILQLTKNFTCYQFRDDPEEETQDYYRRYKLSKTQLHPLPVYVDVYNILNELVEWMKSDQTSQLSTTLFLPPGVGKTTTPRYAAVVSGSSYVCLSGGSNILSIINKKMSELAPTGNTTMDVNIVWRKLSIAAYDGIAQIFNLICKVATKEQFYITELQGNGLTFRVTPETPIEKLDSLLLDALQNTNKSITKLLELTDRKVILHLDEMQRWHIPHPRYERIKSGNIDCEEIQKQKLIIFCSCIQEVLRSCNLKFVFSGTVMSLEQYIKVGSHLKVYETNLTKSMHLTKEAVSVLLDYFIRPNLFLSNSHKEQLMLRLIGPARVFEFFISRVYKINNISENLSNIADDAIDQYFCNIEGDRQTVAIPENFWDSLLIVLYNAQALGGTVQNDSWYFPQQNLPSTWITWASSGVFSLRVEKQQIIIPHPSYIYIWYAKRHSRHLDPKMVDYITSAISVAKTMNATIVGYALQGAVALELTVAYSGLYKKINTFVTDIQFVPIPVPRKVVLCANEGEMKDANSNDTICLAREDMAVGTKIGNIGWMMELRNKHGKVLKKVKFRGEVKLRKGTDMSELRNQCESFFSTCSDGLPDHYAVFFCTCSLLDWIYNIGYRTKAKRKIIDFLETKKYFIIDQMDTIDYTVIDIPALLEQNTLCIPLQQSQDFNMEDV